MQPGRAPFDAGSSDDSDEPLVTRYSRHSRDNTANTSRSSVQTPTPRQARPGPASRTGRTTEPAPGPSRSRRKSAAPIKKSKTPAHLKEIWRLRNSTHQLIPKLPFCRLIKEILHSYMPEGRMQQMAIEALQESTEMYITQLLEDAYRCTLNRNQVTLQVKDIVLVRTLRGTIL